MKLYPYERAAINGEPMPRGLSMADQLMFHGLTLIYRKLQNGVTNRAEARAEKAQLEIAIGALSADLDAAARSAAMWKRLEGAHTAYMKNKTIENADRCFAIIYGLKEG